MYSKLYAENVSRYPIATPLNKLSNRVLKRIFDFIFSLLFLCTLFPLILLIVAVVTELTMPGNLFFVQKRTGRRGKNFSCLKFRTMRVNDQADSLQATKRDARITKWGHILRKTNIDEMPQFINVLLGDMSIVGPRPHMLKHTDEYSRQIDNYMLRHIVKPGITGWSQINGFRGETRTLVEMENRVKYDIWYIRKWSFGLDIYVVWKTALESIFGDEKAY